VSPPHMEWDLRRTPPQKIMNFIPGNAAIHFGAFMMHFSTKFKSVTSFSILNDGWHLMASVPLRKC